jgi:hypothetical protein
MESGVPPSLLETSSKETLIDAIYFVIRVLRNVDRGYRNPAVSTEPRPEVRELAERAIGEIEALEGKRIQDLRPARTRSYILLLEQLLRVRYQDAVGEDTARAAGILAEMRSTGPTFE